MFKSTLLRHFFSPALFLAVFLFVFLFFSGTAWANCWTDCGFVTVPATTCEPVTDEEFNCYDDTMEIEQCTEFCVDVNDYEEQRSEGSGVGGDMCGWNDASSCFNKDKYSASSGRGNVAFYYNTYTLTPSNCNPDNYDVNCGQQRQNEQRLWDSCEGSNSPDCRYYGAAQNVNIQESTAFGLIGLGSENLWWAWPQCPWGDWNCVNTSGGGGGGGGDGGDWWGGGGPPPPPPPASVDLRVNGVDSLGSPLEVPASFTLSWTSANADSCSASGNWSGGKSTGGSESFSDIPRGTYSYTLNCSGPGGSGSDSVSFQVVQVPRCTLFANPVQIVRPQQSTLSWTCQYADSCSIDNGVGSVNNVSGAANVSPIQSTLYSLTCGGLDGSRSFSAMVSVFVSGLKEVLPR